MDFTLEIFLGIIGTMIALAALFAGFGYFKQGKNQSKIDANILLKDDVEALTKKVNLQATDIETLTKKVEELHLSIEEKDRKLSETLAILQGRDPQMQEFIKKLNEYVVLGKPAMEATVIEILPVIKKLDKYLDKQMF